MTFERAVEFVLEQEGGLAEDAADPGGLTRFGISQRAYPHLDIRLLDLQQAIEIYRKDYWDRCSCNQLPGAVALLLFDSAVNQGPVTAIRMLQRAAGVTPDGVIGPITIGAIDLRVPAILEEFTAQRMMNYCRHREFARYGLGWTRRVISGFRLSMEDLWNQS